MLNRVHFIRKSEIWKMHLYHGAGVDGRKKLFLLFLENGGNFFLNSAVSTKTMEKIVLFREKKRF